MRKMFIENIPKCTDNDRGRNGTINWIECAKIQYQTNFIYDTLEGIIKIIKYDKNGTLTVLYNDKEYTINRVSFAQCNLHDILLKNEIDNHYFDIIDTEEKAYILGFFYADACHYEDSHRIKIDLQSTDEDILYRFKNILQYTGNILHYNDEKKVFKVKGKDKIYNCQPYSRLSFVSEEISKQLVLKGCMANKSKIIIFPNEQIVPQKLQKHFIRGYFDGNGTIGYWIANKKTGWKKFNFGICGTTEIINSIADILIHNFNCTPDIRSRFPDRDNNNVQMALCGNRQIKKIMDWLYSDSTIHLQRKYEKYQILIQENNRIDNKSLTDLPSSCYASRQIRNLKTKEIYSTVTQAAKDLHKDSSYISWHCSKAKEKFLMYEDDFNALNNEEQMKLFHKFETEVA